MATKALMCCASTLFSNTRVSSPLLVGLGPGSGLFPACSRPALVVKAQLQGGGRVIYPLRLKAGSYYQQNVANVENSLYDRYSTSSTKSLSYIVRTPWNTKEDEKEIEMWFDMPELKPENIQVNVVNDLLVINGDDGEESKKIKPYDSIIELPSNCWKEHITAVFNNGVLSIKVPKITQLHPKLINIPVKNIT